MDYLHSLDRFIDAQDGIYGTALCEIQNGRKESCWMWYIFPQLRGLGDSPMSHSFGIEDLDEARAYLEHPVLSSRLIEISEALMLSDISDSAEIFGYIDSIKLRSSMTLFALVSDKDSVFNQVLKKYFGGEMDQLTLQMLAAKEVKEH